MPAKEFCIRSFLYFIFNEVLLFSFEHQIFFWLRQTVSDTFYLFCRDLYSQKESIADIN